QQPQLQPLGWRWQGRLDATAPALHLAGRLDNAAGLALNLQVQRPTGGALRMDGRLEDIDLTKANPLTRTLRAWPALLELNRGRLAASATLQLAADQRPASAELALQLQGVGGIYDRLELVGLEARPRLQLRERRLALEVPELRLARLNPGVPLGPLQLRGDYQATLEQPLAGRLRLRQAEGRLLGGQLQLRPATLDLAQRPQRLQLQLRGLDLAELLAAYPAEGLSGSGILDGELPLRLERDGWRVAAGQLAARAPGGVLQLRSPRIRAFGQRNPALRLATGALEDFRYDRLECGVSYAPQGQLLLAMHLHGHNPALEGGRPVNLTVNLEENVPSLLTSLQLSGRVNEAIQRRVQQRLPPRH
ncbi:MAG TPA: YdbH domain-containing protein, partial [Pseudomonas sp.]|nr:YdbH domain-containing protein [Pseudomonas sp.]